MTTEKTAMLTGMIAQNQERIDDLAEALDREAASMSLVSHSWVVVMPLLGCVTYDLVPITVDGKRRYQATGVRPAGPAHRAARYTEESAKTLAADTVNGAGATGTAMHWTDAASAEIAQMRQLNDRLREILATA